MVHPVRQPEREEIRRSIALSVRTSLRIHKLRQGHDLDFLGQRIALLAGIHDAKFDEFQVRPRDALGSREDGRVRVLALHGDAASVLEQQEVHFRAA